MTQWVFDKILNDWQCGIVYKKTPGAVFKTVQLKYTKRAEITIKDPKDTKTPIFTKYFYLKDYKTEDEWKADFKKCAREQYFKYGLDKNSYRSVVYKGYNCTEVKLPRGYSMLVENNDFTNIKNQIWGIVMFKENPSVFTSLPNKRKMYLSKFLHPDIDIIEFIDSSLNFLRNNIKDSGKERTIVTDNIIEKKIKKFNEINKILLNEQIINNIRTNNGFVFDEICCGWKKGKTKCYIKSFGDKIYINIQKYSDNKIKRIIFNVDDYNDFDDTYLTAKEYLLGLIKQCPQEYVRNRYRYVIYKGYKCIEMELTKGYTCIFDIDDLDNIRLYTWRTNISSDNTYFRAVANNTEMTKMHRLITNNQYTIVDHIDGNPLNNCKNNLQDGTNINNYNRKLQKNNKTGYNGVKWDSNQGKGRYIFRWIEDNKENNAYFPVKMWKSRRNALAAAVVFKYKKDKKFGNNNGKRI